MLSKKILALDEGFYVPNVRKNLVNASLLDENGFTLVLGSNKIVIGRFGSWNEKYYLLNDFYKLSIMHSSKIALN